MLEILKQMQKQGIFKMFPSDSNLNSIINNANDNNDIDPYYQEIQEYIRELDNHLQYKYNVPTAGNISDFYDKFYYVMFDIFFEHNGIHERNRKDPIDTLVHKNKISDNGDIPKNGIYEKDIEYKGVGKGLFGLSSNIDVKFKLEERKLLKLIDHYYIKLKADENFQDEMLYIPFQQLKEIFVDDANNKEIKDTIVETCNRLNDKRVYWDLSNTRYSKKLGKTLSKTEDKTTGKPSEEKISYISILYQPRKHAKGTNGEVNTIKGIVCKVNNFMRMRHTIKQISNTFPTPCLKAKYLEFIITEKITYHLNLLNSNNASRIKSVTKERLNSATKKAIQKNIKDNYKVKLIDLATKIYYYDTEQSARTYGARIMLNTQKSKERIIELLRAIANVSQYLSNLGYSCEILVRNQSINLFDTNSNKPRKGQEIYNDILRTINPDKTKGCVLNYFKAGEIELNLKS